MDENTAEIKARYQRGHGPRRSYRSPYVALVLLAFLTTAGSSLVMHAHTADAAAFTSQCEGH